MGVGGRPTDFTPELGDKIIEHMRTGLSLTAAAALEGVHRQRVYEWKLRHKGFADDISLAMGLRQVFLEKRLLTAKEGPVVTSTIFALKNAAAADWREQQVIEHTGADGGPIKTETRNITELTDDDLLRIAGGGKKEE